MNARRLRILVRADCELCEQLLGLLDPYVQAGRVALEIADFDTEPLAVRERHQWRIPVVFEGDTELMWGRVEADEVARVIDLPAGR